jgi:pyridoxal phosphate enzyme (YggS family)
VIDLTERISALGEEIRGLEQQYGREPGSVQILAVSKRHNTDKIRAVAAAGMHHFGENYLQEALEKISALQDLTLTWHFIGPIQSNKTRGIAEHFDWVQSVDREKIAVRLNDQRPSHLPPLNVCVQVNLSQEQSKSGVSLDEGAELCQCVAQLPRLTLRGVMAIPAPIEDFEEQRSSFRQLAQLYDKLAGQIDTVDTLSMGMSDDYAAAIAEGATMIRLGTVIFGPRPA